MRRSLALLQDDRGAAAAELALITPLMMILLFSSMELGNYFLTQHALSKQVRDGARYASRLSFSNTYACPGAVFKDANANTNIINVTKTGSVDGTAEARFGAAFWTVCTGSAQPVSVSIRCVPKATYAGIYSSLSGDIPVVMVQADVAYKSLFGPIGFNPAGACMHAQSEVAAAGL